MHPNQLIVLKQYTAQLLGRLVDYRALNLDYINRINALPSGWRCYLSALIQSLHDKKILTEENFSNYFYAACGRKSALLIEIFCFIRKIYDPLDTQSTQLWKKIFAIAKNNEGALIVIHSIFSQLSPHDHFTPAVVEKCIQLENCKAIDLIWCIAAYYKKEGVNFSQGDRAKFLSTLLNPDILAMIKNITIILGDANKKIDQDDIQQANEKRYRDIAGMLEEAVDDKTARNAPLSEKLFRALKAYHQEEIKSRSNATSRKRSATPNDGFSLGLSMEDGNAGTLHSGNSHALFPAQKRIRINDNQGVYYTM